MTDQVETPSPNQESTTPTPEAGSEDEAVNAFTKRDTKAESTDEPEPGPDDEATEEGADAEPEEAEDEGATGEEVEFEGKTYKNVPPELRKALLRQADYSRSMNEVSAQKKEYTQRIETAERLIEGAEQFAKALAKVDNLDTQLKAFEKVNWQELRASNPASRPIPSRPTSRQQRRRRLSTSSSTCRRSTRRFCRWPRKGQFARAPTPKRRTPSGRSSPCPRWTPQQRQHRRRRRHDRRFHDPDPRGQLHAADGQDPVHHHDARRDPQVRRQTRSSPARRSRRARNSSATSRPSSFAEPGPRGRCCRHRAEDALAAARGSPRTLARLRVARTARPPRLRRRTAPSATSRKAVQGVIVSCATNANEIPDPVMAGPANRANLSSQLSGNSTRFYDMQGRHAERLDLGLPLGLRPLKLVMDRFQRERDMWFLNPDIRGIRSLEPMQYVDLARTGLTRKGQMWTNLTLVVKNEAAHGVLADINTSMPCNGLRASSAPMVGRASSSTSPSSTTQPRSTSSASLRRAASSPSPLPGGRPSPARTRARSRRS
jgi:hypothetical protein